MKKILGVLLLLGCAALAFGDLTLTIRGSNNKTSLRVGKRSEGASFRHYSRKGVTELTFRARRGYQSAVITFKVLDDDEITVAVMGEYTLDSSSKRQYFEWVDINFLKVADKVLIGAGGDKKTPPVVTTAKSKSFPDKFKVEKDKTLTVEIKFRATPRSEARKLDAQEGSSLRKKSKRDKREKARSSRESSGKESSGKGLGKEPAAAAKPPAKAADADADKNADADE